MGHDQGFLPQRRTRTPRYTLKLSSGLSITTVPVHPAFASAPCAISDASAAYVCGFRRAVHFRTPQNVDLHHFGIDRVSYVAIAPVSVSPNTGGIPAVWDWVEIRLSPYSALRSRTNQISPVCSYSSLQSAGGRLRGVSPETMDGSVGALSSVWRFGSASSLRFKSAFAGFFGIHLSCPTSI